MDAVVRGDGVRCAGRVCSRAQAVGQVFSGREAKGKLFTLAHTGFCLEEGKYNMYGTIVKVTISNIKFKCIIAYHKNNVNKLYDFELIVSMG